MPDDIRKRRGHLTADPEPSSTSKVTGAIDDLTTFKAVTISMRIRDVDELEAYITNQKRLGVDVIDKSKVIRKALQLLYKKKRRFDEI